MADQRFGGYSCEFVDAIPDELQTECSICLYVLKNPHLVDCCGHRFCKNCIETHVSRNNTCPLCKHEHPSIVADKQLARILRQKVIRCTHNEEGCKWIGELHLLDNHLDLTERLKGCSFQQLACSYCNNTFQRRQLENHELKCSKRVLICEYCNDFECLQEELAEHWDDCDYYLIVCPKGCGAKVTRISLDDHYNNLCPLSIVDCEYAYAGCKVRVRRKYLKTHLDEAVKDHLDLMTIKVSSMKVAYKEECDMFKFELECIKEALQDRNSGKDQENTVLKKLCSLRQEGEFDTARDQVLIHNLSLRTTEQMLKSLFGQHGPIHAVKLYSMHSIAIVEYQNSDSIFKMFQKYNSTGIRLLGNQLKCIHLEY